MKEIEVCSDTHRLQILFLFPSFPQLKYLYHLIVCCVFEFCNNVCDDGVAGSRSLPNFPFSVGRFVDCKILQMDDCYGRMMVVHGILKILRSTIKLL